MSMSMAIAITSNSIQHSNSEMPYIWSDQHDAIERCIVPMSSTSHKGSSGRIGVLGGSARYTGAPYYAAMASLKAGADLAFVFCAEEAAIPIKCYSPELMVAPVYQAHEFDHASSFGSVEEQTKLVENMVSEVVELFPRMHVLIIGPGLGRCPLVMKATAKIILIAKERNLPLVIDADGLFLLSQEPNLLDDYDRVVITPNAIELKRLQDFKNDQTIIVEKGKEDIIFNQNKRMICKEEGGMKRSGGIGDILSGIMGTFVAWHFILQKNDNDFILSCWSACCLTKRATKQAFEKKKRSMTAPDILNEIGDVFDDMVELKG